MVICSHGRVSPYRIGVNYPRVNLLLHIPSKTKIMTRLSRMPVESLADLQRRARDLLVRLGRTRNTHTRVVVCSNVYIKWKILKSFSSGLTLGTFNIKK